MTSSLTAYLVIAALASGAAAEPPSPGSSIAQKHGLKFHLFVRRDVNLSKPLVEAIDDGLITLRYIP